MAPVISESVVSQIKKHFGHILMCYALTSVVGIKPREVYYLCSVSDKGAVENRFRIILEKDVFEPCPSIWAIFKYLSNRMAGASLWNWPDFIDRKYEYYAWLYVTGCDFFGCNVTDWPRQFEVNQYES